MSLSAGRDFEMLATASKRSGDDAKAAMALFNLGVTLDNSRQYGKAIEVCSSCWRLSRRSAKRLRGCVRVSCGRGSCVYRRGSCRVGVARGVWSWLVSCGRDSCRVGVACVTADVIIGIRVVMAAPRGSCRRTASS